MMKNKLISLFVLMLALFLCVTACDTAGNGAETTTEGAETTAPAGPDESTSAPDESEKATDEDVTTAEPVETEDPKIAEGNAIKAALIEALSVNGSAISLPSDAFASLAGDYMIGMVESNDEFSGDVKRMWRKGNVLCTEYDDGSVDYVIVQDGYEINIYNYGEGYEVGYVFEAEDSVGSILNDLELDLSGMFGSSGGDFNGATDLEFPEFTPDMITFSADLKTFTFSKDFTDALVKGLCSGLGTPEEELDEIVKNVNCTAVYNAETDEFIIAVDGLEVEALGVIDIEIVYGGLLSGNLSVKMEMDFSMNISDMPTDAVISMEVKDIKMNGEALVSATMTMDVTMLASVEMEGMKMEVEARVNATYTLNFEDPTAPRIDMTMKESTKTSVMGQVIESSSEMTVMCDLKKNGTITVNMTSDGETVEYVYSGLLFGADATYPEIPSELAGLIDKAIAEYEQEFDPAV